MLGGNYKTAIFLNVYKVVLKKERTASYNGSKTFIAKEAKKSASQKYLPQEKVPKRQPFWYKGWKPFLGDLNSSPVKHGQFMIKSRNKN